jgi:galactokinase
LLRDKYELLLRQFETTFNQKPDFFARAPGRVNLIGEHIDYCGYSVLPMAIEHDIIIAASSNQTSQIHLANFDSNFK